MLMPAMTYSQAGLLITQSFEQCRLVAYQDSGGVPTIGWGHTRGVGMGLTCTKSQADEWLHEDLGFSEAAVNQLVNVPLTQGEFDALVDFCFNCGVSAFRNSGMRLKLNAGDYAGAAAEFDSWDHVHGKVIAGLLRRRQLETQEFNGAD